MKIQRPDYAIIGVAIIGLLVGLIPFVGALAVDVVKSGSHTTTNQQGVTGQNPVKSATHLPDKNTQSPDDHNTKVDTETNDDGK